MPLVNYLMPAVCRFQADATIVKKFSKFYSGFIFITKQNKALYLPQDGKNLERGNAVACSGQTYFECLKKMKNLGYIKL